MHLHSISRWLASFVLSVTGIALTACGGGSSSGSGSGGATPTYSIGGTLSGLASGQSVVLQDNGGNNLTVSANGTFTFTTQVSGAYAVTVLTQPNAQNCTVSSGSGTATANVTAVEVACVNVYPVAALVSGLAAGHSVVLQDNGASNLTVSANGTDTFTTAVANNAAYAVTVLTQPSGQTCTPQSGTGTIAAANVTVDVVCVYTSADSALDGPYTTAAYSVLLSSSPEYFVDGEGTTTYDGAGNTSFAYTDNVNGTIITGTSGNTYAVQNGQLTNSGVVNGGVEGVNQNLVVGGAITASSAALIAVGVRQGSGMSLAALTGTGGATYFSARLSVSSSAAQLDAGTLTINADGSGSFSGSENINGTVAATTGTYAAGSVSVSATGGLSISTNPTGVGGVSPDYDLFALSNQTSTGTPDIHVAVRTGSGESLATFDGQYTVVAYQDGYSGGDDGDVQVVTILADGQGHYTSSGTENSLGTISSESGSGTYTVAASGALAFTNADGTLLNGAVSMDGNAVVLSQISSGKAPQIVVGVRQ